MTSPQYPGTPQQPRYPPFRPVHAPTQRSAADVTATSVMSVFALLAGMGSFFFSWFFAMATDACMSECNTTPLDLAYLVTWGGIVIAGLVALVGMRVAGKRGWAMWIWPTVSLVLIVVTFLIGLELANSLITQG
ncbi:hypothetical protein [Mycobacterium shimoidei]|uniref:Uncharacterized protein n=1 Tax=Mycobacterium shimoidei TaxID=29313 RepID=A0A1E3TC77_MYCSH|nr:hypothetical protein [Mycobacterium shimoidei]MCV7260865.1 hypothetical protein [Mycobacterium shimoidei]ODR12022.1 hypothetical protein BHQ16_17405 [Mycobacterium shimoidei]ORW79413.1 hypothetical protein AWC26_15325 [Mycobacterium shimoidei]SRX93015.1 hypothetical protein MSP7336_01245 [Mycobacterium shimoidei]